MHFILHTRVNINYLVLVALVVMLSGCGSGKNNNNIINAKILTGTPFDEVARRLIVDESRQRVLIAGKTNGDLGQNSNAGGKDTFISEYDLNLKLKWTTLLGSIANDEARAMAINSSGEIYVSGSTAGNLGGEINQGTNDAYLAKLDKSGKLLWVKLLGSTTTADARGLAVDSQDNIYIGGGTGTSLNGSSYAGGKSDIFLAKYDGNGNQIWLDQDGGNFIDAISDITVDSNNNIYACGVFSDNGAQIYLAKYNTSGNRIWSKVLGEPGGNDFCSQVVTDSSGNIYITGNSATDLNGNTNQGDRDIVIAKYDSDGNLLWIKLLGTSAEERGRAIDLTSSGDIIVTGSTMGNLNNIDNSGMEDIFVAKFDTNGALKSVDLYGTVFDDRAVDIDITSNDSIYISGRSSGDMDGNKNVGASDIFIKKL